MAVSSEMKDSVGECDATSSCATSSNTSTVPLVDTDASIEAENQFSSHDFNSDQEWKKRENSIFIAKRIDSNSVKIRYQREYFKQNLNPNLLLEKQTSSSTSKSSSGMSASRRIRIISNYTRLVLELSLILLAAAYILFSIFNHSAITAQIFKVLHLLSTISTLIYAFTTHGIPRLNRVFWRQLFLDENVLFIFSYLCIMNASPFFLALLPNVVRASIFTSLSLDKGVLPMLSPAAHSLLSPYLAKVHKQSYELSNWCASLEVFIGILFVMLILTPYRNIFIMLFYLQYLRIRYMASSSSRAAFTSLRLSCDSLFLSSRCPSILSRVYMKLTAFLFSLVDPAVLNASSSSSCSLM